VTNPPRVHHFVPQFWIKKFAAADDKLWSYDSKDDRISERSSRQLMQVFDLYTIQPSGVDDTTLETVDNNKIDNDGSMIFDRILNGRCRRGRARRATADVRLTKNIIEFESPPPK
jgi:hypothetical protein